MKLLAFTIGAAIALASVEPSQVTGKAQGRPAESYEHCAMRMMVAVMYDERLRAHFAELLAEQCEPN